MRSIQRQLTWRLFWTVVSLAALTGAIVYFYMRSRLTAEFDRALVARAKAVAGMVLLDEGKLELIASRSEMNEVALVKPIGFFEIWDSDGTVFARSPSLGRAALPRASTGVAGSPRDLKLPTGGPGRAISFDFVPRADADGGKNAAPGAAGATLSATVPRLALTFAQDRGSLDETLHVLAVALALGVIALCFSATMVVAWTVRQVLLPVHRLSREADEIHASSLHQRFSLQFLPSELQPICRRLNELLNRLHDSFQRERRFTANVAHELRTPIAELRTLAEVSLKWPRDADVLQNSRDAHAIATRMQNLVQALLAMARCEAGLEAIDLQALEVNALLREAWRPFAASASQRQLEVTWDLAAQVIVISNRDLLTAVFSNIFSNAIAYAPERGSIRIQMTDSEQWCEVRVMNTALGMTNADIRQMFEPFWRSDPSRSGHEHCGLGLCLVSAYAGVLGCLVKAELPDDSTYRISIRIGKRPRETSSPGSRLSASGRLAPVLRKEPVS